MLRSFRHFCPWALAALLACAPAHAQTDALANAGADPGADPGADIVFTSGTGITPDAPVAAIAPPPARRDMLSCTDFFGARSRLLALYPAPALPVAQPELFDGIAPPAAADPAMLDRKLLETALSSYHRHNCLRTPNGTGPAQIIVVDFAKPSTEPRLYIVDLKTGQGLASGVPVAHGIGSDRDDDGIADRFSNAYNSLASSLGAARGAELYHGANGLSLRLDGLDSSNSQMRIRDIVAHSYQPHRRRYFNASLLSARDGKPGTSEGCFVVAPHLRDWLFDALRDGGFLFAGLGGKRAGEMPAPPLPNDSFTGNVQFVAGTGVAP